ncbi:cysteine-rich RLK (RECEPTOR-like protein kinase) 8 [Striga hermonthica]|uniref:Cysteine-rich RLK (RECEPTOR-like protein kinase) 8 n=1 Tax=Striga hermonthica TaxID=68872 RepID=A0A9N7NQ25_STRHE|nr:cysteine-rich RLK (RECEPTOR-like protein kinase) 8 [Striga hermonthica]
MRPTDSVGAQIDDIERTEEEAEPESDEPIAESSTPLALGREPRMRRAPDRWVYRVKEESDGTKRYKARLVVKDTPEDSHIAAKELVWLQNFLNELGRPQEDVALYSDSQSAIHLAKNPAFHSRTKHIEGKYHFIRQLLDKKVLQLKKVSGKRNPADMLTKATSRVLKKGALGSRLMIVDFL